MSTIQLLHSGASAFVGYSAFVAFVVLENYPSAVLGLIAGSTETIVFFLQYLLRKGRLRDWYSLTDLRIICRYGIVVATIGLLSLGYHTTIQIMYKQPILPVSTSYVIPIIWSIIAMRSGIILMYYTIKYQNMNDEQLLANEESRDDVENAQEEDEEPQNNSTLVT